jgi:hypothetical protein
MIYLHRKSPFKTLSIRFDSNNPSTDSDPQMEKHITMNTRAGRQPNDFNDREHFINVRTPATWISISIVVQAPLVHAVGALAARVLSVDGKKLRTKIKRSPLLTGVGVWEGIGRVCFSNRTAN